MTAPDGQATACVRGVIAVVLGLALVFVVALVGLALSVTEPIAVNETFEGQPWNVTVHEVLVGATNGAVVGATPTPEPTP